MCMPILEYEHKTCAMTAGRQQKKSTRRKDMEMECWIRKYEGGGPIGC